MLPGAKCLIRKGWRRMDRDRRDVPAQFPLWDNGVLLVQAAPEYPEKLQTSYKLMKTSMKSTGYVDAFIEWE